MWSVLKHSVPFHVCYSFSLKPSYAGKINSYFAYTAGFEVSSISLLIKLTYDMKWLKCLMMYNVYLITGSIWSIIGYEFTYPWIDENWRQRILLKIKDTVHTFYLFFF